MKRLLFILTLVLLLGCSKEEETRIFTLTVNAVPPEAGTVTLEMTQETTGEYKWGSTAIINAKPSEGYEFLNWTGNVYLADFMMTTHSQENNKLTQGIEMRCLDITFCTYDIKVTGNFVKKN
tara:strand:- start:111 stop:476 length:366 start_codon:yes stop_codon:yes gene_type:complete